MKPLSNAFKRPLTPSEQKNLGILTMAIKTKSIVRFDYETKLNKDETRSETRYGCPFLIGFTKNEKLCLRTYALPDGQITIYNKRNWRIFDLDIIQNLQVLNQNFEVRAIRDYNPDDREFDQILQRI